MAMSWKCLPPVGKEGPCWGELKVSREECCAWLSFAILVIILSLPEVGLVKDLLFAIEETCLAAL